MALQGDGNGIVTIPNAIASGDFSIVFSSIQLVNTTQAVIGSNLNGLNWIACFAGGDIRTRVNNNNSNMHDGTLGQSIKYEVSRTGATITVYVNDVVSTTFSQAGDFQLNTIFALDNSLYGSMLLSGTLTMTGFSGAGTRTYDFEGSGSTLVDTTSGENGTLSGFTTGGFTGGGDAITITSVVDHQSKQRNGSNQAVFTIAGNITGTATSVEYQLDSGAWSVLDASPTSTYSGNVTITNEQSVSVRFSNNTGITATVSKLKAAACIVIGPAQSNAVSRIDNAQTFTVDSGKPTPAMYKSGVFSALSDPTGVDWNGSDNGSLWPYIAKQYSDLGIPVCIGNVAEGGTTILQWAKGGSFFDRIAAFATACGGLEFAISLIGESDSVNGTSTADFKTRYLDVATDINTDYSCDTYAVYFPVGSNTGTTQNVNNIRTAYDELIAENAFIKFGGDLSVIDISSATNPANDNLHIKLDADATTASQIIYQALTTAYSTLSLSVNGIPDGSYMTVLDDASGNRISRQSESYTSGALTLFLPVAAGTTVKGYVDDGANPSTNGAYLEGVTA